MSIKLTGNGMWESSRMMLPEHKLDYEKFRKEEKRMSKPTLLEDEIEEIVYGINESFGNSLTTTIEVFGELGNRKVSGIVAEVNQYSKKIKIVFDDGYEYIDFDEIMRVKT